MIGAERLFPPLDRRLKIPVRGASSLLQRKVCEANYAGSFEKASRLLDSLAGLNISAKRVQLITERVGAVLLTERDHTTSTFMQGTCQKPPPAAPVPLLVITADGGRVQTRQEDRARKWKENKVAVVYNAIPSPERQGEDYHGPKPIIRSLVATMASWEQLGDYASTLAEQRHYAYALKNIFISDGAPAIRSLRERCFIDATFVLDWAHAVEHLHQCALAAYGPGTKAETWAEQQKDRLWNGRITALISQITKQSRRLGLPPKSASENDPRRILANNVNYFTTNRDAMDYPTFRKNGWPIGSGIIESTIKQIGKRIKGTEKHWSMTGVEETMQVVTHLLSEDNTWDNFWQRCPLAFAA